MTAEEDLPEALKKTVMGSRELRMCQSRGRARSAWWLKTVKVSLVSHVYLYAQTRQA
jgi:hypothetical protein